MRHPGKVLRPDAFAKVDGICKPGIHASKFSSDAQLSLWKGGDFVIWQVIIPKGARYYKSTVSEAQFGFDEHARGSQYRASKMILVKEHKPKKNRKKQ